MNASSLHIQANEVGSIVQDFVFSPDTPKYTIVSSNNCIPMNVIWFVKRQTCITLIKRYVIYLVQKKNMYIVKTNGEFYIGIVTISNTIYTQITICIFVGMWYVSY